MSLPNDVATRLGGAILTGGSGISQPYVGLPAELITRLLVDYRYFEFDDPIINLARSGAGTTAPGLITSSGGITTTTGWVSALTGAGAYSIYSGQIVGTYEWGSAVGLSAGSVNNTGWNATLSGTSLGPAGSAGSAGPIVLGGRGYPRRLAFGGSVILAYVGGNMSSCFLGLGTAAAAGNLTVGTPPTFTAANGLAIQFNYNGTVQVTGRRGSSGTPQSVSGMSVTLPVSGSPIKVDFVVATEFVNAATITTLGTVEVYLRQTTLGASGSTTRPPGAFKKFLLNSATLSGTSIPQPAAVSSSSGQLYPFLGAINQAAANDQLEPWYCDNFWYAVERS